MQQLPVPLDADSEGKTGVQKSILQKVKQGKNGQNGLAVSEPRHTDGEVEKWDSGPGLIFFSPLGQPLNHSLLLPREVNPKMMGTAVMLTPGPEESQGRGSLRKSERPGVHATAMTSSSISIEVTTLATQGPILLPHSLVLLSPMERAFDQNPQDALGNG